MHNERRRFERQPVGFYIHQLRDDQPHRYFATDLSLDGLYMEWPAQALNRSSPLLQLEIRLPRACAQDAIWATAEVIHDRMDSLFHGSGVRFKALTSTHARWLRDWLRDSARTDRFITHPGRRAHTGSTPLGRSPTTRTLHPNHGQVPNLGADPALFGLAAGNFRLRCAPGGSPR